MFLILIPSYTVRMAALGRLQRGCSWAYSSHPMERQSVVVGTGMVGSRELFLSIKSARKERSLHTVINAGLQTRAYLESSPTCLRPKTLRISFSNLVPLNTATLNTRLVEKTQFSIRKSSKNTKRATQELGAGVRQTPSAQKRTRGSAPSIRAVTHASDPPSSPRPTR